MKKMTIAFALAAISMTLPACNNAENDSAKTAEEVNDEKLEDTDIKRDADFAVAAASGGIMEVQLGNLAMANGASAEVKEFGRGMVTDHGAANDELKALAQTKNITLPAAPDNDMQKKIDDLSKKTGADFDKAYMDMMVDDHKNDIDKFKDEADRGNDPDIKGWAASKVPTLEHHLQMAQDIKDKLKK